MIVANTTPDSSGQGKGLFHSHNRRGLLFCMVFVLGAVLYGYDGTYFTGILAMTRFKDDFGTVQDGVKVITASNQSLFASIVQVGEVLGSLSAGLIGDHSGRKGALLMVVLIVTLGAVLQLIVVGSTPLLVVGRLILGAGVGIASNCVPCTFVSIVRALFWAMVSSWQLFLAIGQVIGAVVAQGTKDVQSTFSWRFPIAFNIVITLLIALGLLFVPESPRWLISKDRSEDAHRALERIHKKNDDIIVQDQVDAMVNAREAERESSGGESRWADVFKGTQRRRFLCAFGILVCQQISGVQFIFSYATVFFESIGQTDAFLMTIISLGSGIFPLATLVVCGALGIVRDRSKAMNTAIASMIMIYVFVFNLAWGPLAWVVATELATGKNRTKIMSVGTGAFWIAAWAVTFTLPYLYNPDSANLGPMVCWIYFGGAVISWLFVYFMIPETLGRSLEEINMMLEREIPTREWKDYKINSAEFAQGGEYDVSEKKGKGAGHIEHIDSSSGSAASV
ncbi:MFS monosaccharide transporter [Rhizoctonia solani]|uniref:MFS monosaccharide transporter n=1 Tax=Rhizoctonia solani TaxID=456999 RepID=A0A8H7I002_9AGAM|nr:MFS monosaccharide transporter [Rhizoctonia solani]